MFYAKLEESCLLKRVSCVLASLFDEIPVRINEEGIYITTPDSAHVYFVDVKLGHELFEDYYCDKPLNFLVETCSLYKVMSNTRSTDSVELRADKTHFIIRTSSCTISPEYTLDVSAGNIELEACPNIHSDVSLKVSTEFFRKSINVVDYFDPNVFIGADDKDFFIYCDGFGDSVKVRYQHHQENTKEILSRYSITPLKNFLKIADLTDFFKVNFSHFSPIIIHCDILNAGYFEFILAPIFKYEDDFL